MDYKTMLIIHPFDASIEAIKPFIALADKYQAHLNIVVLATVSSPPASVHGAVPTDYWVDLYNLRFKQLNESVSELEKLVQKSGISASVSGECVENGLVENLVSRHSLYADVVVMSHEGLMSDDLTSKTFNGAIFETGRPVLVLAGNTMSLPQTPRVLIAWDDSTEAAKAVHNALSVLKESKDIHVVVIDPVLDDANPHPGVDLAAYLVRHGLDVTVDQHTSGGRPIEDVLTQKAIDIEADIIVMGAYGHSRFRQWLLGGTTRNILTNPPLPILMSH